MLIALNVRIFLTVPDEADPDGILPDFKNVTFSDENSDGELPVADQDDIKDFEISGVTVVKK